MSSLSEDLQKTKSDIQQFRDITSRVLNYIRMFWMKKQNSLVIKYVLQILPGQENLSVHLEMIYSFEV